MQFHIPIKLPSLANTRLHWRRMVSLKKEQRQATRLCFLQACFNLGTTSPATEGTLRRPLLPWLQALTRINITITRIGPRNLDSDNLSSACKYVRDEIAAHIGVDDGSPRYDWRYNQRIGKYGVDVEITTDG